VSIHDSSCSFLSGCIHAQSEAKHSHAQSTACHVTCQACLSSRLAGVALQHALIHQLQNNNPWCFSMPCASRFIKQTFFECFFKSVLWIVEVAVRSIMLEPHVITSLFVACTRLSGSVNISCLLTKPCCTSLLVWLWCPRFQPVLCSYCYAQTCTLTPITPRMCHKCRDSKRPDDTQASSQFVCDEQVHQRWIKAISMRGLTSRPQPSTSKAMKATLQHIHT
jgi:hypothetical protein